MEVLGSRGETLAPNVGRVQASRWRTCDVQAMVAGIERNLPRRGTPTTVDVARLVKMVPFSVRCEIRRGAAGSAVARQRKATTDRIELEMDRAQKPSPK